MTENEMLSNRVSELEKRVEKLERMQGEEPLGAPKKTSGKKTSIKEFMLSKKPTSDVQRALVIGYYLENFEGMKSFNVDDLAKSFRAAKHKVPDNPNDKVNHNIGKGHMMEAEEKKDNKKAWVLTSSGEQFVENSLQGK